MANNKTTDNKDNKDNKISTIRFAAVIALAGNLVLAVLKIITGAVSNSAALVADGIDSSADVLISVIALIVVRIIAIPADTKHPWGHGRAETVATALLSFTLFFVGAQLIINTATAFFAGERRAVPSLLAIFVTLISIAGKIVLAWSQFRLGKRAGSAMIKANAKNMAADVLISVSVLVGLVVSSLTGTSYADTIIAMLIGAWIIRTAIGIFLETNLELMDGNRDIEPYRVIIDAVNIVEGASNPHRARMRRIAGFWDIDLDIDVDSKCTILEAHSIATKVEKEIKQRLENVFDIMIHVEPRGNAEDEMYGLSEDDMSEEQ